MDLKYEISAEKAVAKDVVKCLLSVILFHRLFGPSVPQTREVIGVTYPCVVNTAVDTSIEEKSSQLLHSLATTSNGQIGLQFFEKQPAKKKQKSWFGAGAQSQDVCWEQWVIKLHVLDGKNDRDREMNRKQTEKQLLDLLTSIVTVASTRKDHIPPITTTDATPFPYKIVVGGAASDDTWGAVFKKILE